MSFKTGSQMGRHAFSTVTSASFGIVTSVLLDAVVIALFGMGRQTDAYFIAVTIPTVIITILLLQATRVVQPVFMRKRRAEGEAAGWNYINLIMTGGTAVVTAVCIIGALLSPLLIRVQATGSPHDAVVLSTRLSVFLFFILPLYFPIAVMSATLNSFDIFALPGAMKFFENIFKILFVLLLGRKLGVQALVLGTFAGALCQISSFYFVLKRKGFRYKPIFQLKHPDMIQAYSLIVFQLAGQLCGAGMEVVNNTLGSMLGAGNVSALRLATRIIESFGGLVAGSIILAAMPTVAASAASGDREGTKKHLQHALYLLLLVTVPLSVWLGLMHRPLIAFLYERARFSAADTTLVAHLLLLMIPYIFLARWWGLLELPFFAEQNTRTPLVGILITTTLYVIFSLLLVKGLGIYAIPIARSLAGLIGPCFLIYMLRRRMGNLGFGAVRDSAMQICAASLIMAVFMFLAIWLLPALPPQGFGAKVLALGLPSAIGAIALFMSLLILGALSPSLLHRLPPYFGQWPSRLLDLAGYPKDPL